MSWIPGLLVTTLVYVALVSLSRGQTLAAPATRGSTTPTDGGHAL